MSQDSFYWDLAELNPDAVVFDEFQWPKSTQSTKHTERREAC